MTMSARQCRMLWRVVVSTLLVVAAPFPLTAQVAHCQARERAPAENLLLKELAAEDQAARRGVPVTRRDDLRVTLVLDELARGTVCSAVDHARAGLVLDHSPLTIREGIVVSPRPTDYLLAHLLAARALDLGYEPARLLVAQTIDRYLTFTVGVQRYGTNRLNDLTTGEEYLVPIDRTVTDEERARYGVAPLAALLRQFPERARPTPGRARSIPSP